MSYFKDLLNKLHFLDDDTLSHLLPSGSVKISDTAAATMLAPTASQLWAAYQQQAHSALDKSDMVALRCFKAAVVFPVAWATYVTALRAIVGAASGDPMKPLPTAPTYPAGT